MGKIQLNWIFIDDNNNNATVYASNWKREGEGDKNIALNHPGT